MDLTEFLVSVEDCAQVDDDLLLQAEGLNGLAVEVAVALSLLQEGDDLAEDTGVGVLILGEDAKHVAYAAEVVDVGAFQVVSIVLLNDVVEQSGDSENGQVDLLLPEFLPQEPGGGGRRFGLSSEGQSEAEGQG